MQLCFCNSFNIIHDNMTLKKCEWSNNPRIWVIKLFPNTITQSKFPTFKHRVIAYSTVNQRFQKKIEAAIYRNVHMGWEYIAEIPTTSFIEISWSKKTAHRIGNVILKCSKTICFTKKFSLLRLYPYISDPWFKIFRWTYLKKTLPYS